MSMRIYLCFPHTYFETEVSTHNVILTKKATFSKKLKE